MSTNTASKLRWRTTMSGFLAAILTAGALAGMLRSASAEQLAEGPLPTVAFLADAGNFPDALAAGAVVGPMGGPVLLTGGASLDVDAGRVLDALRPDLVVIAGGPAAVSEQVSADVEALGLTVRRVAGQRRTETAAALAHFAEELGFERPVVTGQLVTTDLVPGLNAQYLDGRTAEELIAEASEGRQGPDAAADDGGRLTELEAQLSMLSDQVEGLSDQMQELEAENTALVGQVDDLMADNVALAGQVDDLLADNIALDSRIVDLETDNAGLHTLLDGVSRGDDGFGRDTLTFTGMNVQIVNGEGTTDTSNGLGNLVVGYNALRVDGGIPETDAADRTGSHYVVTGDAHHYTAFAGLLAGFEHSATGQWASITGGRLNTASGSWSSVTGGSANTAAGDSATVSGGMVNAALGHWSSVSGGAGGTASGQRSSISGGWGNAASGNEASVSGGGMNLASGGVSAISGGASNTAQGSVSSVSGGQGNTAGAGHSSILGGSAVDTTNDHEIYPGP